MQITALLERASRQLKTADASFAKALDEHRLGLSSGQMLVLAALQPGELRNQALSNSDVRQAIAFIEALHDDLPQSYDEAHWQLLNVANPQAAAKNAKNPKRTNELSDQISFELSPLSPAGVLDRYWSLTRQGETAAATQLVVQAKEAGITLPFVSGM
jgi:hypothetical protein